MRITFVIVMLICSCCMKAQNTTRGKVATHMALVRTYLATGDTVSALKEYQIISDITPNDENIKKRIAELSASASIPPPTVPVIEEEAVVTPVAEETVPEPEGDTTITEEETNAQDFSKFGGFGNYKRNKAVKNNAKKAEDDKPKQSTVPAVTYKQREDALAKAFAMTSQDDNSLFRLTNPPSSPLHSLLTTEKKDDEEADLHGRWISSFRSNDIYSGTMFMLDIAPSSNKLELIDEQSRFKSICESNGYTMENGKNVVSQGKVTTDFSVSYEAHDYGNVKMFVDKLLKPFFNGYVINNPETLELLTKGVLIQDTIINEIARNDTLMTLNSGNEPEIVEVVLRDTTVNSYYKLDSLYKIRCNISFNAAYTRNTLHGCCTIEAFIDREECDIHILKAAIPCCFYRVEDDYNDNCVCSVSEETYYADNKQKNEYDVEINDIGMEKCFERLASGREKKSADALNVSADLMTAAPCGDLEQAYKWFGEAASKNNAYAMMRLGQMQQRGKGCAKDTEGAISLLEESLANDCFDAGYELALIYIELKSLSKAYSKAIESASNGSIKAMKLLSEMYLTGIAVRPNAGKAQSWLKKMQETISQENN